jgi:hypothetical protein
MSELYITLLLPASYLLLVCHKILDYRFFWFDFKVLCNSIPKPPGPMGIIKGLSRQLFDHAPAGGGEKAKKWEKR